jgi:hypothetical protein
MIAKKRAENDKRRENERAEDDKRRAKEKSENDKRRENERVQDEKRREEMREIRRLKRIAINHNVEEENEVPR